MSEPTNAEIADVLYEFADRLEADDVEYKPSTYRRAADNVADHPTAVTDLANEGADALQEIDRVGKSIAGKIVEFVETGSIEELEALRGDMPVEFEELTRVEGVGPKTVGTLYRELDVQTLTDLERVAQNGEIQELDGFGKKSEQNILDGIGFARESRERELLGDALPVADDLIGNLEATAAVDSIDVAGSIRRRRPTIGDVDVLVATTDPDQVVDAFLALGDETIQAGTEKASMRRGGIQCDLRVVAPEEWGSALQYFTGSKEHNVQLRNYALEQDISLNEYGAYDISEAPNDEPREGHRIAGDTEESMYAALDLPWIPPAIREATGEIEAAEADDLPELVETADLRGDCHVHTSDSDGAEPLEMMVEGAADVGHEYIAITDHASGPGILGSVGLSDAEITEQAERIRNYKPDAPIEVFAGIETNIKANGELSTADAVLADLDIVVAAPHSALNGDATDRLITAVEHPHVDILGHPSGRLLNQREGMEFDPAALGKAAAAAGTALEINADPARLDLWGSAVKAAIEHGAMVAINTDAHAHSGYTTRRLGVAMARRGWAEPADVLNTRNVDGIRSFCEK